MKSLVVKGGRLGPDFGDPVDIRIAGGRIACIAPGLPVEEGEEVLEARGLWILPGAIDNHVHFRDPGLTRKEDFGSGSRGALRGGVTTVLEVQNNPPLLTDARRCREKIEAAGSRSLVNFGLYPNLLEESLDRLGEMAPYASAFKLFMGSSTGLFGVTDYGLLRELFRAAAETERLVVLHCEEESVLRRAGATPGLVPGDHGSKARPPVSEALSIAAAIELAREWGSRIHVFHLSTARGLELVSQARASGLPVSASTCPHYLYFTEEDYGRLGAHLKTNPAIHTPSDRNALLEGLASGDIEVFSTDHAPHLPEEKALPFHEAPSGLPSIDLFYPLLLTLVQEGRLSMERALDSATLGVARLHGLRDRGEVRVGAHADLALVDGEREKTVGPEDLSSRSGWTPYEGRDLVGWPVATLVGGRVAWDARRNPPFEDSVRGSFVRPEPPMPPAEPKG